MPNFFNSIQKNVPVIIRIHAITLVALVSVIALALMSAMQLRSEIDMAGQELDQRLRRLRR